MKRNIGSQIEFKREHKLLYIGYQLFPDLENEKKEETSNDIIAGNCRVLKACLSCGLYLFENI